MLTVETDSVPAAESGGGITLVLVGQHQADGQEPDVGEVHPGLPLLSLRVRFPTVAAGGSRRNTGTRRGSHSAPCRKGSFTSSTSPSQVQSRFLGSAAGRSAAQLTEPFHPDGGEELRERGGRRSPLGHASTARINHRPLLQGPPLSHCGPTGSSAVCGFFTEISRNIETFEFRIHRGQSKR